MQHKEDISQAKRTRKASSPQRKKKDEEEIAGEYFRLVDGNGEAIAVRSVLTIQELDEDQKKAR